MGKEKPKKGKKKEEKEKKVTASSVIKEIFARKNIPSNDDIIAEVKKRIPNSNFDGRQLAWYKSRAKQGKLPGLGKVNFPKMERVKPQKKSKTNAKKVLPKKLLKKKKKAGN